MLLDVSRFRKQKITNSETAWKILKGIISKMDLFCREKEHLFVIGMNTANNIKYIDHVSMGSLNGTTAMPREVYRQAVHQAAASIIIGHNHPSDNCTPSESDVRLTKQLVNCGKILQIEVVDHIIVCKRKHYSFADAGVL
jgi:DNA repair protein RadC